MEGENIASEYHYGLLNWYDSTKGFGVIKDLGDQEVFLHYSNLAENIKPEKLAVGVALKFVKVNQKQKISAQECTLADDLESLKFAINRYNANNQIIFKSKSKHQREDIRDFIKAVIRLQNSKLSEHEIATIIEQFFRERACGFEFSEYEKFIKFIRSYTQEETSIVSFDSITRSLFPTSIRDLLKNLIDIRFASATPKEIVYACRNSKYDLLGLSSNLAIRSEQIKDKIDAIFLMLKEEVEFSIKAKGELKSLQQIRECRFLRASCVAELGILRESFNIHIDNIIIRNLNPCAHMNAWEEGLQINLTPIEIAEASLIFSPTQKNKVLNRLTHEEIVEVIKTWIEKDATNVAEAIIKYLAGKHKIYENDLKRTIFFKINDEAYSIYKYWMDAFQDHATPQQLNDAYLEEWIHIFDENLALDKWGTYNDNQRNLFWKNKENTYFFKAQSLNKQIDRLTSQNGYIDFFQKAQQWLTEEDSKDFEFKFYKNLTPITALYCWVRRYINTYPELAIVDLFTESSNKFHSHCLNELRKKNASEIQQLYGSWITELRLALSDPTKKNLLGETLINSFNGTQTQTTTDFYSLGAKLILLQNIEPQWRAEAIKLLRKSSNTIAFAQSLNWYLGNSDDLDFDLIKNTFVYYTVEDQLYFIKKLFSAHVQSSISLTPARLAELIRVDLDIYQLNQIYNPEHSLDISADIVIECLLAFQQKGKFLLQGELISLVLKKIGSNTNVKLKIADLFLECPGRTMAKFDFPDDNNRTITFSETLQMYEVASAYKFLEEVKALPGRRFENRIWLVPKSSEEHLRLFAIKHNFIFLLGEKTRLSDNPHFAKLGRENIPDGIQFCEGRKANIPDSLTQKEFWWCHNQSCYCNADKDRQEPSFINPDYSPSTNNRALWEDYVLLDFLKIFGFNVDEHKTNPSDFVPDGLYYQFAGLINRFKQLLEKLNCKQCGHIMLPVRTSHFAYYSVVRFWCECEDCSERHKEVYLNHCFNYRCWNIVDSRETQQCSNGMYMCDECGSCCSHNIFDRRLQNLRHVGGYIHPELIERVATRAGHLERNEVYCNKCKHKMHDQGNDTYNCTNPSCDNTYDKSRMHYQIVGSYQPKKKMTW